MGIVEFVKIDQWADLAARSASSFNSVPTWAFSQISLTSFSL